MKPTVKFLCFVVCSFGFFANGQSYHNFPVSNAIWNSVGHNVFTSAEYEFRFGLYGDTVINSKTWSKVYSMYDTALLNPLSAYFGAVREDADKKVWFVKPGFDETILYDFDAQVGDTIWYQIGGGLCGDTFEFWPQTTHYLTVNTIDSILLENSEYRKQWNLSGNIMEDHWVEGIGSIAWFGLFNPIISDIALCGDGYSFACFRQNYENIYLNNENCASCYCSIITSYKDIFDNRDNKLSVFPNPAENSIVVDFIKGGGPYTIQVVNMTGQVVYARATVHEDIIKIPVSNLLPGQYTLMVRNADNGTVREGKLIVK